MRGVALTCALVLAAASATGEDAAGPALAEVLSGAQAMAAVGTGFLFVAKEDSAWVCAISANPKHFAALMAGDDVVAEQTVPGALCVPADHFKNLAE